MLDRIRIGSPTAEDLCRLRSQLIQRSQGISDSDDDSLIALAVAKFMELMETDNYVFCILPLNELVNKFNEKVMELKKLEPMVLKAVDVMDSSASGRSLPKKRGKINEILQKQKRRLLKTAESGGLEEDLALAVGSRVMLRRNLDITNKLVNGSIGFVEDITVTTEGGDDRIYVRFQDCPDLVAVSRVKSKYYVAGGLYIERSQFPLSLAYAITVHKSQGLSLQSAVLDLGGDMFSKGMGYVALSRVTNLSRVHIIRLCASKIVCDEACIKEYNRLRSINKVDEPIRDYNKNPERDAQETQRKQFFISPKDQITMLTEEAELRTMSNGQWKKTSANSKKRSFEAAAKPKQKRGRALDIQQPGMYLKLTNLDAHSCFANAVLQCTLRCHDLFPRLQLYQGSNAVVRSLLGYFDAHSINERSPMSAASLRESFGYQSQYSIQSAMNCDPAEFIADILNQLPSDVTAIFRFAKRFVGTCPNSHCGRTYVLREDDEQLTERGFVSSLQQYSIQDVYSGSSTLAHTCSFCRQLALDFPVRAEYSFEPLNRYIILNNPVMYGGRLIGQSLSGVNERNLTIFHQRWKLVACVQMVTSTPLVSNDAAEEDLRVDEDENRHYTAYIRHHDTNWIHLNDTAQHITARPPILRNMVLMVLERIPRQYN